MTLAPGLESPYDADSNKTGESGMSAPKTNSELDRVVIDYIDRQQGSELLDRQARKYLGMSGPEFARAFCAGELDTEDSNVLRIYFLLGFAGIECDAG
jgi:hypothetical protein